MGGFQADAVEEKKEEQTEFTVKLTAFDDGGKVKLIKEVKNIVEGMNLVQVSKSFITPKKKWKGAKSCCPA